MKMGRAFDQLTNRASVALGKPLACILALACVVIWAACGPFFGYSESWQMVINTGTTIITFVMAFIILASSNRSEAAMQVKMDELLRSVVDARNDLIGTETLSSEEIESRAQELREAKGINNGSP